MSSEGPRTEVSIPTDKLSCPPKMFVLFKKKRKKAGLVSQFQHLRSKKEKNPISHHAQHSQNRNVSTSQTRMHDTTPLQHTEQLYYIDLLSSLIFSLKGLHGQLYRFKGLSCRRSSWCEGDLLQNIVQSSKQNTQQLLSRSFSHFLQKLWVQERHHCLQQVTSSLLPTMYTYIQKCHAHSRTQVMKSMQGSCGMILGTSKVLCSPHALSSRCINHVCNTPSTACSANTTTRVKNSSDLES